MNERMAVLGQKVDSPSPAGDLSYLSDREVFWSWRWCLKVGLICSTSGRLTAGSFPRSRELDCKICEMGDHFYSFSWTKTYSYLQTINNLKQMFREEHRERWSDCRLSPYQLLASLMFLARNSTHYMRTTPFSYFSILFWHFIWYLSLTGRCSTKLVPEYPLRATILHTSATSLLSRLFPRLNYLIVSLHGSCCRPLTVCPCSFPVFLYYKVCSEPHFFTQL